MKPYLSVKNITKVFPGVTALSDVSIDFKKGEVHALLGENGAGKSTLIKIISGIYHQTKGSIEIEGKEVHFTTPKAAIDAGISVIHQELSIAKDLTVDENIFLGEEPHSSKFFLDKLTMNNESQKVLDSMGVKISAKTVAKYLTAAEQQMVEIAKIVKRKSKIVILDEPTSSLSSHEINSLFEQIKILRDKGVVVIYISHRMAEIFQICDTVTVLKDGIYVDTFNVSEITETKLVASMVGREMQNYYNRQKHTRGKETLRVEHLTRKGEFKDISFSAYQGEILGFSGLIGAGRTEIMETIFGARKKQKGSIFVNGEEVDFQEPKDAIAHGIGMVTEDRRRTGLLLDSTVRRNISLPSLVKHLDNKSFVDTKWEKEASKKLIKQLEIKTPSDDTLIKSLSGGNQQKVILAKWIVADSKIMILDEPTRGIDVNAKSEFYKLMNDFVAKGGTIIMVSSELPEILGISDRIIVMREGSISGSLDFKDANEIKVMSLASTFENNREV
ncbi:MAG: sugar ABC transporter ATP-binding protein [Sphaerochaetaceae bacterium]